MPVSSKASRAAEISWCPKFVNPAQYPNKLAKGGKGNRYHLRFLEEFGGGPGLLHVVAHHSADKDVRIRSKPHFCPAQPAEAASLISSRVATFRVLPASKPRKASIFPAGRIALSVTRPSGSLSNAIFSPGRMPRCRSTSLRNVTCPRAYRQSGHGLNSPAPIGW